MDFFDLQVCDTSIIGTLGKYDGDGNVHHTFLYISFPSLHNYDMKWSNFKFT